LTLEWFVSPAQVNMSCSKTYYWVSWIEFGDGYYKSRPSVGIQIQIFVFFENKEDMGMLLETFNLML